MTESQEYLDYTPTQVETVKGAISELNKNFISRVSEVLKQVERLNALNWGERWLISQNLASLRVSTNQNSSNPCNVNSRERSHALNVNWLKWKEREAVSATRTEIFTALNDVASNELLPSDFKTLVTSFKDQLMAVWTEAESIIDRAALANLLTKFQTQLTNISYVLEVPMCEEAS